MTNMDASKPAIPRVNNSRIDDAHDEIINRLGQVESVTSRAQLLSLMIDIYKHAAVHFLEEEQFMTDSGMPPDYLSAHREEHKILRESIHEVINHIETYPTDEVKKQLLIFKESVVNHIEQMDKQMEDHL